MFCGQAILQLDISQAISESGMAFLEKTSTWEGTRPDTCFPEVAGTGITD